MTANRLLLNLFFAGMGAVAPALAALASSAAPVQAAGACPAASAAARGRPVLDIGKFGAHPDDGADDANALAAAITAAGPEATLLFKPGRYRFSKPVALADRQTYLGEPGATLTATGRRSGFVFTARNRSGVRVACLAFEGGGVMLGGFSRGIAITGNSFAKIYDPQAAFGHESAIFIAGLTNGPRIAGNDFRDIGMKAGKAGASHGVALLAYHLNNAAIENNQFERVHQAVSLIFQGRAGSGLGVVVRGNRIAEAFRMGIEAQGEGTSGARFEGNEVAMADHGSETIGLSIVINGGEGTVVSGNRVTSLTPAEAKCGGFGIEAAGVATKVLANRIAGNWCAPIGIYADETQYSLVADNRICGHASPHPAIDFYKGKGRSQARGNRVTAACGGDGAAGPATAAQDAARLD